MPNKKVFFSESQRFRQWWIWLIIIGLNAFLVLSLVLQLFFEIQVGNNPASNTELIIIGVLSLLLVLLFVSMRLHTEVREDGVYFRFAPFHRRFRALPWPKIDRLYVRKYRPIGEYGGWGLRFGLGGRGMAYNVQGNQGLQLICKDGKRILIGTQKPEELERCLKELGHYADKTE